MILFVGTAVVAAGLIVLVAAVTAIGSQRRGAPLPLSILAGAVFPLTWTIWYVRDDHLRSAARPGKSEVA